MIVDCLRPELLHAPIVRVSDERRQAARLGVRRHEVEHPPQPRPLALRHRLAVLLEQQIRREEQLQHEPVVGRRLLEIDAIFRDLLEHLVAHNAPASGQPVASSGGVLEEQPEEHETGAVAQVVVSVHIGRFGVREHELAVHEQAAQEGAPEPRVRAGLRACHEVETPDPADGAQRHVHRAGPVHAVGKWIDGDPILDLCPVLARVSVVAGQPVRLPKGREVLTAAQFPRHFHVGCLIELHVRDVAAVLERIVTARLEIVEPRKPGAEGFGARAEQVELVPDGRVCSGDDARDRVRVARAKRGGVSVAIRRIEEEWRHHLPFPQIVMRARSALADDRGVAKHMRVDAGPRPPRRLAQLVAKPGRKLAGRHAECVASARKDRRQIHEARNSVSTVAMRPAV